jgi:hypothetical protein
MVINHPRAVYATQPGPLQNQIAGLLTRANGTSLDGEVCAIIVPDDNKLEAVPWRPGSTRHWKASASTRSS